ncbi:MAG: TRAP transporter small permease [Deltaproteobacteria bacterium]|nr:TRAP transporter small permease [Deltaproteobacteria bacterium]
MNTSAGFIPRLSRTVGILGIAAMAFMVVSLFYDVMMRYLFAAPTHWALEVNTFLLLFLCTVPTADVLSSDVHIRVTFLTERMPPRIVERLPILRAVAGILFCAAMAWKGSIMSWQAWQHNDRMSTSLGTPMFIPYLLLPLGFILLGLQYAILLRSGLTPQPKEAQPGQQI